MLSGAGGGLLSRCTLTGGSHRTIDPLCLENPRPAGAEPTLTENVASPFQAEPRQPDELQSATAPVNNDRVWQITARNEVNYDMFNAFDGAMLLENTFNPKRLRSLTGPLSQQLEVTEGMLKLALYFADLFGVSSFGYEGLATGARAKMLRALVTKVPPGLVTQSVLQDLFQ